MASGNKDITRQGAGSRWPKGQSGNPAGRPKKLLTTLGEMGYSESQVRETMATILALPASDLARVAENPDCTVLEAWLTRIIVQANKTGNHVPLESLITRLFGAPKQTVQAEVKVEIKRQKIKLPDGNTLEI